MRLDTPLLSRLRLLQVRKESALLDTDLAALYGVETKYSIKRSGETPGDSRVISLSSSRQKNGPL
jgi:hypothetical protein